MGVYIKGCAHGCRHASVASRRRALGGGGGQVWTRQNRWAQVCTWGVNIHGCEHGFVALSIPELAGGQRGRRVSVELEALVELLYYDTTILRYYD